MVEPDVSEDAAARGPQTLEELFGGPRGMVDGAVPPIVFVAANALRHDVKQAALAAVASAVVLLAVRVVRREPMRHVFSGFFGVAVSAFIAVRIGKAEGFFLPGIALNGAYLVVFLGSVLVRRPIVGLVLKQFSDKPSSWHAHPTVRRTYMELTLLWAAMYGLRVGVQTALVRAGEVGWLAATKIALGWPVLIAVLAVTMPYLRRRTADVPIEGDAVALAE